VPLHYLDTSALVKRYVSEQGSAWVEELFASEPVAVSSLAAVELASALARRTREGDLTPADRDSIFSSFLDDTREYVVLAVTQLMTEDATTMLLTSPPTIALRTLDALHLATARVAFASARRRGLATGSFVTADRALGQAVTWAGLTALNPEDYS
jgi:predicted nucleic acid-binding protein